MTVDTRRVLSERRLIWIFTNRSRMLAVAMGMAVVVGLALRLESNSAQISAEVAGGFLAFQLVTGEYIGREIRKTVARRKLSVDRQP